MFQTMPRPINAEGGGTPVKYEVQEMTLNTVYSFHTKNAAVAFGNGIGSSLYVVFLRDGVFELNPTAETGAYFEARYDSTTETLTLKWVNASYSLHTYNILYDDLG